MQIKQSAKKTFDILSNLSDQDISFQLLAIQKQLSLTLDNPTKIKAKLYKIECKNLNETVQNCEIHQCICKSDKDLLRFT